MHFLTIGHQAKLFSHDFHSFDQGQSEAFDTEPHAVASRVKTPTFSAVGARSRDSTSMLRHYIDLAVKSVAKIVRDFGDVEVKEQIAKGAKTSARVSNAYAVLPAVGLSGSRIDSCD